MIVWIYRSKVLNWGGICGHNATARERFKYEFVSLFWIRKRRNNIVYKLVLIIVMTKSLSGWLSEQLKHESEASKSWYVTARRVFRLKVFSWILASREFWKVKLEFIVAKNESVEANSLSTRNWATFFRSTRISFMPSVSNRLSVDWRSHSKMANTTFRLLVQASNTEESFFDALL